MAVFDRSLNHHIINGLFVHQAKDTFGRSAGPSCYDGNRMGPAALNHGRKGGEPASLADYDYTLPPEAIAKEPVQPRDASRMLVVDRRSGRLTDAHFRELARYLCPSDLVVVNNTRVLKARVFGRIVKGGRDVEVLFANPVSERIWEVMLRPGKRVREGDRIDLDDGVAFRIGGPRDHGLRLVELETSSHAGVVGVLERYGHVPLPPYIGRPDRTADETDYQTVYADKVGAVAAPTAGLHFSDSVFASLDDVGIEVVDLTLHVGIGTFIPVRTDDPADHRLKGEHYEISLGSAEALNRARQDGRRIVAVGTTTTRTLEHVFARNGKFVAGQGETDLYILPGHRFAAVDLLLTNFHLPRTTLLLLVSAFASRKIVLDAYSHALREGYRFYSYGDCTLFA